MNTGRKLPPHDPRPSLGVSPRFALAIAKRAWPPDSMTDEEVIRALEEHKRKSVERLLGREVAP